MTRYGIVLLLALINPLGALAGDWLQFRGNNANCVSGDKNLPRHIAQETIHWSAELPGGGLSGPIVIGDRVIVTSSSGFHQDRLHVLCFSTESGNLHWERQFWATGSTTCHEMMRVATPTPASDGERIFALYSSNDLACLDLDGRLLWYRSLALEYPNASNSLGMASSPIVVGETVILQIESDAEAFAMGVHAATGMTRWTIPRSRLSNWTSPTILGSETSELQHVVLQSQTGIDVVHPQTGEIAWSFQRNSATTPSSTVSGKTVFGVSQGLTALEANALGDDFEELWSAQKLDPGNSSPVVDENRIYVVSGNILKAGDTKTGKMIWRTRLGGDLQFWSTPLLANQHLYLFDHRGRVNVVHLGSQQGKVVSEYDLGETILCTPAASKGAIYIRSHQHLWKLAN